MAAFDEYAPPSGSIMPDGNGLFVVYMDQQGDVKATFVALMEYPTGRVTLALRRSIVAIPLEVDALA